MTMEQVLILDTETTGLDPAVDHCIEVAAIRYSLKHGCMIEAVSRVIPIEGPNAAEVVNRIPAATLALDVAGASAESTWQQIDRMASHVDAVCAHNAEFDRSFIPIAPTPMLQKVPWIDTCDGMAWPQQSKPGASLITLALDHGIGVVDSHRALADCLLLAHLFQRCAERFDVAALLAQGLRPRALFQALVSFEAKDSAKAAGFHWDAVSRRWLRRMAIEDAGKLGFRTQEVRS